MTSSRGCDASAQSTSALEFSALAFRGWEHAVRAGCDSSPQLIFRLPASIEVRARLRHRHCLRYESRNRLSDLQQPLPGSREWIDDTNAINDLCVLQALS